MFKNLRRSVLALAVVAGSTVAVPVAQQASATGVVAQSAVTSGPSIGAQSVPTWTNTNIIASAAGGQHTCAIQGSSPSATTGSVFCWGKARSIGDGTTDEANVPVLVSSNEGFVNTAVSKVAAGGDTSCAIEGGSLWCWGGSGGFAGNLGNGTLNSSSLPIKVLANGSGADAFSNNGNVTDVAASFARTCAIEGGKVFCWGYENDALGLGGQSATPSAAYANRVADSATPGFRAATATSLHMGVNFHCAMAGGQLWCWGYGSAGELGDGGTSGSNQPKLVGNSTPGTEFTNASLSSAFMGDNHGCAIVSGKLSCWGRGTDGRLGSGASSNQLIPAAVAQGGGFTNASAVTGGAAGDKHSCAIEAGILYCWGLNGSEGRLGNGGSSNSNIPVKVSPSEVAGFTNTGVGTGVVTAVTASGSGGNSGHVCAIENKVAYCWGSAFGGRLGVGQVFGPGVNKPTKVLALSAPGAATIDSVMASNGSLFVSIRQPSDGGSIITGYDYTTDNGVNFTNVARPSGNTGTFFSVTIPSLTNGTCYSVQVRAVNAIGAGAWSTASTGTPSSNGGSSPCSPTPVSSTPVSSTPVSSTPVSSTPVSGSTESSGNTSASTPAPTLVTSANAAALVRAPGSESIIINGEEVVIESNTVNIPAARTPAAQRTAAQVKSIQQAGAALLQQFLASLPAGATSNVTVVNTATGAVMQNLVFDANGNSVNVPVEDIVFLDGPQLSLMIGSDNANITSDGKYQIGAGGIVGVTGSGLGAGTTGELVAMSTPTLLANFQTTAAGDFTKSATLPSSIGVGDHTLVVATGSTYAMMGIRVVPAALPTTGATTDRVVIIALFTLVFGALFFRGRRTFAL
jgi:alpha-tubulin suppressor-like RCC1 family protein